MKRLDREARDVVAVALANGASPETEFEAAEAVLDAIGWPAKQEWRIRCAQHGEGDDRHRAHVYRKPTEARARGAAAENDGLCHYAWQEGCAPWVVESRLVLEWRGRSRWALPHGR